MSKISTYPILSTPTLNDLLIGTDVENLNETKNFSLSSIGNLIGQNYVPYVGATGNVDLGVYSIEGSAFIVNGGTASQFLKADGTLDSTFYVPQTRTITINSVGYDLSANRSWDLPTIDSLTTLGTSGAATYIGKVLNIPIYQAQGNYITQLSGEATALGPGNATVTLSNSAVISKVLTGLNITGGNVIATDTILQAFGKVQNQINGLTGGVTYQGTWNAATNTPFLQSSVGTKGYYYVVSVPGTTNLNGITDWQLGDWAIYNGTAWEKVDNTDAVVSVNGYTGAVMLTYSDVGAPPATRTLTINGVGYDLSLDRSWTVGNVRTDQTYADPSWITSLGWSKIINTPTTLAGYGITDGVSTARTLTINGVGYNLTADRTWSVGTVTSVGTTAPLTGGTITGSGTIGITQASAISDGYLSSTDWSTFNSKQDTITASAPLSLVAGTLSITQAGVSSDGYLSSTDWNTFNSKVGGSGTANYLPIWTSSSVLGNSSLSFSLDTLTVGYNSITGGAVSFTNIGLTPYTYSIQMNNFGSPRSTFHNYTDGIIVQAIASTQVSRMFDNGNFILGTGTTDTGHKLTISGDLYVNTIANAIVDTDRFIVSDGGVIKYRTGAEILTDIGAVSSVGLTMPSAFTVSNSPITSSGTIAVTGAGTAAQYIRGDGTLGDFPGGGGGGGASVSYYLNGSVNQGTFGGNTYYEMNKTPIFGPGTDFNISVDGYVAQFITDVGDPDALLIPGGNWNFETYFSASSGGGSPTFYIELYKYDGTTFTLIASNSTNPELIAFGTTVNPYFSALAVPETVLLATDRLAVRIYVSTSGRTITLHTENSNLCQVITTFTTGLTALNGLTKQVQYFSVGTSGTDFNISSSVATHTFNLPTASAVNRGALSSSDWSTFNAKQNALTLTTSGSSGPATLIGATLNIPDYGSALSGYVPYTGASQAVNLGIYSLSAGSLFVNGPAPTSGSYLGFKQATSVTTGGGGYTSISTFGTSQMNFSFAQPSGFKEFKFDVSSITTGVPGGRVYTMPDADGTIALVGGSGVGTVTSVAALTLGTSGTDLSSTVANSTTTPVITLNVPTASATNRGALSSADWTTFNNKQNALTNPVTGTGTTNYLPKFTGSTTIGNSNLINDASGNVGLGVTPSAWFSTVKAIDISTATALWAGGNGQPALGYNVFVNTSGNLIYKTSEFASRYEQISGQHQWYNAPSGTAGNTISFTQAMTLTSGGNLLVGTTSDNGARLQVSGTANFVNTINPLILRSTNATTMWTEYYYNTSTLSGYIGSGSGILSGANASDFIIRSEADLVFTSGGNNRRMTITSGGNVGIGTSSPTFRFDVETSNLTVGRFWSNASGKRNNILIQNSANWNYGVIGVVSATGSSNGDVYGLGYSASGSTAFTEVLNWTSSGNVGIGTSSPAYKLVLESASTTYASSPSVAFYDTVVTADARNWMIGNIATDYGSFNIASSTTQGGVPQTPRLTINRSGNVGIGYTSPTYQLQVLNTIGLRANGTSFQAIKGTYWGYSTSYPVVMLGDSNTANFTTVSIGYDPSANANGAFSGDGREVLFRRGAQFVTPNAANNAFNLYNLVLLDGNVGIGVSPLTKLHLQGASPNYILLTNTAADGVSNAIQGGIIGQSRGYANNLSQMASILFRNENSPAWYKGEITFNTNGTDGTDPNISPTERMRITSGGNVGIGITSPSALLQVRGPNATGVFFDAQNDGAAGATFSRINAGVFPFNQYTFANGYVGIGTSSPGTLLHVNGSGTIGRFQSSISYVDLSFINSTSSNGFIQYNGNNFNFFANSGSTPTMTITGGAPGNVLIGTTTDSGQKLQVNGGNVFFQNLSSTLELRLDGPYGGVSKITNGQAGAIAFETGATERMRITSGGEVQIQTNSNSGVVGTNFRVYAVDSDSFFRLGNNTSNSLDIQLTRSDTATMFSVNGHTGAGYLAASAWSYGSDIRIKENIEYISNGLDKILFLKPAKFDYINGVKNNIGWIAQDVQEVIPEAVDVINEENNQLTLKSDFIVPYLVAAIKEQQKQIEELKNKVS